MARSRTSGRWLQEHVNDPYVRQAQKEGFRSRSAYKLLQLNERDRLLRPGMRVVDLGSAPGGWSQVAGKIIGEQGRVIATDILPMESLRNVEFVQGDFTQEAVFDEILRRLAAQPADLVLCDMAPNISGVASADQAGSIHLAELALDLAQRVLRPGGDFVVKVFQGEGSDAYLKQVKAAFERCMVRKPPASRARSREVYAVARGLRAGLRETGSRG